MSKLVIFGEGNYAEQAYHYFTNDSSFEVVAFTADAAYITRQELCGLPVLDFETIETTYPPGEYQMFVALGYQKLNKLRASKYDAAKAKGYILATYIGSKVCNYGDITVGDNCFIIYTAVIQPC